MAKKNQVVDSLKEANLDALVCFLPENILFLSGYWPNTGDSAILYPVDSLPVLIVPEPDVAFIPSDWIGDVVEYGVRLEDDPPNRQIANLMRESIHKKNLLSSKLGCELSFETLAGTHIGGETKAPGIGLFDMLETAMPEVVFDDQTILIQKLRMVKTPWEIEAIKLCHEIVGYAIEQARTQLREGMKETEFGAIIESTIQTYGVGYKGVRRARGFAFVVSGPKTGGVYAWGPYNISTDRVFQRGDLVLLELDTYADGYWSDISRTFVVGEPNSEQEKIMGVILEANGKVVKALQPGMKSSEVDRIARDFIHETGYGDYFPHKIGHGVGFAFHEMPYLSPKSDFLIEPGMVLAIEPGIYIPNWGGIRVEDNVLITDEGKALYLSEFAREF